MGVPDATTVRRGELLVDAVARDAAATGRAFLDARAAEPQSERRRRGGVLDRATIATLALGLVLTLALSGAARSVRDRNDTVLLRHRTREAGAVVTSATSATQLPMTAAGVLAQSTGGDVDAFRRLFAPLVGAGKQFVSVTLWTDTSLAPRATVGESPEIETLPPARWRDFFQHAEATQGLSVLDLLSAPARRLGYAVTTKDPGPHFVVYAESALPQDRRLRVASDSAFSDFGYALYVGTRQDASALLASSEAVPLTGRHASTTVPFGDTTLTLVMKPHKPLGGSLMERLPWILLFSGVALTLLAALLVERLARRRKHAEVLARELNLVAAENARLYEQQREVAETLQHSLLPEALPQLPGVQIAGRFAAGTPGLEIGGDWYDVLPTGSERCIFVVGDVSGRGVRAGTIMAKLRYSARAYAVAGDTPPDILDKMSKLVSVREGHFATVLCGEFDASARRLVIANAGHLPAILLHDGCVAPVGGRPGVPIGVSTEAPYTSVTVELPERGTLLAFTDGLVERRGECLDVGLDRVAGLMRTDYPTLDSLLDGILEHLQGGADDDTAMLGLQWNL